MIPKAMAIVDARIHGQGPYRFVVDMGASSSAISRMLAERLMMSRGVVVPVMGAAGSLPAKSRTGGRNTTERQGYLKSVDLWSSQMIPWLLDQETR